MYFGIIRIQLNRLVTGLFFLFFFLFMACAEEAPPIPSSLDSPASMVVAEWCESSHEGETYYSNSADCEGDDTVGAATTGTIHRLGLITNRQRESITWVDLDALYPTILDVNLGEPGMTGMAVCAGPAEIELLYHGLIAVVHCEIDESLAVISVPRQQLLEMIPLSGPVQDMAAYSTGQRVAMTLPALGEVQVLNLNLACEEEVSDRMPVDCLPTVSTETVTLDNLSGTPAYLAFEESGTLHLSYGDKSYISMFALEQLDDEQACIDDNVELPCEWLRVGLGPGCQDGVDNDGDGLVDQEDLQCYHSSGEESLLWEGEVLPACSDGQDNDGDGLVDHDDMDCLASIDGDEDGAVVAMPCRDGIDNDSDGLADEEDPDCRLSWWSAEFSPACSDGLDGDGDGDVDYPNDIDCPDPAWDDEARSPACSDGEDNDDDGLADYPEDPDCLSVLMDFESEQPACFNGLDDDGDGVIDLHDPGCSGPDDEAETAALSVCSDGLDNDGDGLADTEDESCYGAAGGSESPVVSRGYGPMILDETGQFLVVYSPVDHYFNVLDVITGEVLNPPARQTIGEDGISLSESGALGDMVAYEISILEEETDLSTSGRKQVILIAAGTEGLTRVFQLQYLHYIEDQDGLVEVLDRPLRPLDGNADSASVYGLSCLLPDAYREAVREARGEEGVERVTCEDVEVPQLETGDEGDAVFLVQETQVAFDTSETLPVIVEETVPLDWALEDEDWSLTYEGLIPHSFQEDGGLHEAYPELLLTHGVEFCELGVVPGDYLVIEGEDNPTAQGESCEQFNNVLLEYEVVFVRDDMIQIGLLSAQEGVVQELPTLGCFPSGFSYYFRSQDSWIVEGSRSGLLHDQVNLSGQCVPGTGGASAGGRIAQDSSFQNRFFSLSLQEGTVPPLRDVQVTFSIDNNFSANVMATGPQPVDVSLGSGYSGRLLLLTDAGMNTVSLYDAETLLWLGDLY